MRDGGCPVFGGLDPALQRDGSFVTPPLTLRWYKKTVPQSRLFRGPGRTVYGGTDTPVSLGRTRFPTGADDLVGPCFDYLRVSIQRSSINAGLRGRRPVHIEWTVMLFFRPFEEVGQRVPQALGATLPRAPQGTVLVNHLRSSSRKSR